MNNDLISREYVKAKMFDIPKPKEGENFWDGVDTVLDIINNAPAVDIKDQIAGAYNEGWMCGNREAEKARPQGEWYEHIDKGLLKARHGNYVVYDVDYLLEHLAREVNLMESVRRQKGGAEND